MNYYIIGHTVLPIKYNSLEEAFKGLHRISVEFPLFNFEIIKEDGNAISTKDSDRPKNNENRTIQ